MEDTTIEMLKKVLAPLPQSRLVEYVELFSDVYPNSNVSRQMHAIQSLMFDAAKMANEILQLREDKALREKAAEAERDAPFRAMERTL